MSDYIQWLRGKIGSAQIIVNFVAGWIEDNSGRILLQKRSPTEEIWGFPGGAIELGESAEEALIREVREETGLNISVEALLGVYTKYFWEYQNGDKVHIILIAFRCSIVGGSMNVDHVETFDLKYFPPYHAPRLFTKVQEDILKDGIAGEIGTYR